MSGRVLASPYIHSGAAVDTIMYWVVGALLPAAAWGVYCFGWPAFWTLFLGIGSAMVAEWLTLRAMGRPNRVRDGSAALTGLLLAMTLPPYAPWGLTVLGSVVAIVIGKQIYGGLGYNPFNPALIARVILLVSFPVHMTTWPTPIFLLDAGLDPYNFMQGLAVTFGSILPQGVTWDTVTSASLLGQYRTELSAGATVGEALTAGSGYPGYSWVDLMLGRSAGSLGEVSALLLLLGGAVLLFKRIITWHIPVAMIGATVGMAAIFWTLDPTHYLDPMLHLFSGGLILGALFMATDMVTSPTTPKGQLIFGASIGILTYVIRTWGGYPEGVSFAIVIMNMAVPFIDQYTRPRVYGHGRKVQGFKGGAR